jgi:hypothetical protein
LGFEDLKMIKKLVFFFLVLTAAICNSQTLQKGWSSFEGTVGKSDVVVNIYCDSIGNLTGNYCYKKYETRIALKGKLTGNTLFLDEFADGKINAKFYGTINEENNTLSGKWSSTTHSDLPFSLRLHTWTGNSLDSKYSMETVDAKVESFLRKTKKAILTNDKTWLSKNTKFPLTLYSRKDKLKIKNSKDFVKKYSLIITKKLKESIQESCICDIFANSNGTMIANGSIWINEFDKKGLKISAINN